jgi:single-stranded DNA-binding protein
MKLKNKSIIEVIAYDNVADFCYQNLKRGMHIFIEGKLNSKMEVQLRKIQ